MSAPGWLDDAGVAARVERRRKVREWWSGDGEWAVPGEPPPVGLALSGGGIRSATFSLGLIQALAKAPRDALGKIDVLSTVSGGGYIGCFLRAMFVPASLRGIEVDAEAPPSADLPARIADQYRFARHTLASDPCERVVGWKPGLATDQAQLRNPLWWLREHSRYLAPTGMTDFSFAIAYIARNWLAMVYVVVLACVALGTVLVSVEALALAAAGWPAMRHIGPLPISPLFLLAGLPIAVIAELMIAYWATQAMSTNERDGGRQWANLAVALRLIAGGALAIGALLAVTMLLAPEPLGARDPTRGIGITFVAAIAMGVVISLTGAVLAWAIARNLRNQDALLTTEFRRRLTAALAASNRVLVIILAVATIDSFGAALDGLLVNAPKMGSLGAVLLPVLAFLIKKLPDWFGGGSGRSNPGGGIGGLLKRFATTVALVVGAMLYAMLAILALAVVHHALWPGAAWQGGPEWWRMVLLAGVGWILTVVLGKSNGFINLSSLHSLYASRLTRAYLGASNVRRLEEVFADTSAAPVTENHARDYIQPRVYGTTDLPAPIHVVHVTLNETIDPRSQIVSRDRKGRILSLEPDGVRDDIELKPWAALKTDPKVKDKGAENISLGQWIAISGAAASSGMGRMSSLGFALAFTFANVRLGYWWWSPRLCSDAPVSTGVSGWLGRHFGTFVYLFNEMTCRYSRGYYRKYLTDGGHYENSGAFVLIRRRVPLILVTDNGADPDYTFADLESLVRQSRIDLGAETRILGGTALDAALARLGTTDRAIFVDPETHPDWRARMTDHDTPAYVLVLEVAIKGETLTMIWIKPRLIPGVPTDIAGYQIAMTAFPQQPTGDQFFDEAQWESYRKLGEISMARLLETCPKLLA